MNFLNWYRKRGTRFVLQRARKLTERYSLTSKKAEDRIRACTSRLIESGCCPTYFVPAVVVKRNLNFIKELQGQGCEIGVHGYQHIDMLSIPPDRAVQQLINAEQLFRKKDIQIDGFRCPYLSISDALIKELPSGIFNYSSNRAINWLDDNSELSKKNLMFTKIGNFYQALQADKTLSLPWQQDVVLEIPVSIPDDIQMRDGMLYSPEQISTAFFESLKRIHLRGELFNLMFHPELASILIEPFLNFLHQARDLKEKVWMTQLRDIYAWWKEKDTYSVHYHEIGGIYHLEIQNPNRATLLLRGIETQYPITKWDEKYNKVESKIYSAEYDQLPLVSISHGLPSWVKKSLGRMGYITVDWDNVSKCTLQITEELIREFNNPIALMTAIEDMNIPLIRFWPWPDGYRSALCLTGDLDALSLMDYATRLIPM